MNLSKIEADAMRKIVDGLNAKGYLTEMEQAQRRDLVKRLADGESLAVMEKALKQPKFRLDSI